MLKTSIYCLLNRNSCLDEPSSSASTITTLSLKDKTSVLPQSLPVTEECKKIAEIQKQPSSRSSRYSTKFLLACHLLFVKYWLRGVQFPMNQRFSLSRYLNVFINGGPEISQKREFVRNYPKIQNCAKTQKYWKTQNIPKITEIPSIIQNPWNIQKFQKSPEITRKIIEIPPITQKIKRKK